MNETRKKLYVDQEGFCTEASMLLMVLAVVFRVIGSIGRWGDMNYLLTQVGLPVFCGLLFVLFLLLFGKRAFWTSVIPVVLGAVFFIFRIMEVENNLQKVGCIVLYMVIVVLYAMCFSHKNLKWLLAGVLFAAFAYHVGVEDVPVLLDLEHPVSFVDGMQEMSVLAIMLSLMFACLAMRDEDVAVKSKRAGKDRAAEQQIPPEQTPPEQIAPEPAPLTAETFFAQSAVPYAEPAPAFHEEEEPAPTVEEERPFQGPEQP